jgi:hypothetical protein
MKMKREKVAEISSDENKMNAEETANTIMYMVQDRLDDISSGACFDLKQFEKEVLELIKNIK